MNSQERLNSGAAEVSRRITERLWKAQGPHVESLLCCLGALAGYACQMAARMNRASAPGVQVVTTRDGGTYVVGDAINGPLAENPLSVWALITTPARKTGKPLPDIEEMFAHSARTVGGKDFGVPRVPPVHRAQELPLAYLKRFWAEIEPIALKFCDKPAQLPMLFAIAIQRTIEGAAKALDPAMGARIAMECAVPMSTVTIASPSAAASTPSAKPTAGALRRSVLAEQQRSGANRSGFNSLPPVYRILIVVLVIIFVALRFFSR